MAETWLIWLKHRSGGGYKEEFVNPVEEDLQCSICHLPLKEAVQTGICGHRFCKQCLNEHFMRLESAGKPLTCPLDRNNLTRDKDIFPDKATERKILSFLVKCPSKSCRWTGELRSKDDHLESCPLKLVPCLNKSCPVRMKRKNLEVHVTNTCKWRIISCDFCDESYPEIKTRAHQDECKRCPLNCPKSCGAIIVREEMVSHEERDCPLTTISCPYAHMGCATMIQRRDIETHLQSTVRLHLDMASRALEKKVDALERRQGQRPGKYTWKINGFNEVLGQAKNQESRIESEPFYHNGYKFRMLLKPNGNKAGKDTHLSVYFQIMKGEYDAILPWPFHKKLKFSLIDQQENLNDRENIVLSFTANPENRECFGRPVTDENTGHGFSMFVLHDKLRERRYIVDDTIFIQLQVVSPR